MLNTVHCDEDGETVVHSCTCILDVHSFMYMYISFISIFPTTDTRPTLLQLTHLVTPSGKTMEIIKSIAAQWRTVGIHMDFDPTGHTIDLIGADHPLNHVACCTEMMQEWLGGRGRQPANWATLVRVLDSLFWLVTWNKWCQHSQREEGKGEEFNRARRVCGEKREAEGVDRGLKPAASVVTPSHLTCVYITVGTSIFFVC